MQLKCGKNESVIKSWDYAYTKQRGERKTYNLTVTDKRMVASSESSNNVDRREIYLDDVKTMDYSFSKSGLLGALLLIIFGVFLSIVIIGIFMIINGVHKLKEGSFTLTITTRGEESDGIALGASSFLNLKKKRGKLKVKVDREAAIEIINELGAILTDAKDAKAA